MQWFNRSLIVVIIGCLNVLTYTIVCAMLIINLKYYHYSEYDYNDYTDVYESYKQRREAQVQREIYGSIYVAMCIIMDLVSVLLIWGVLERRPRYMFPWILGSFVVFMYSALVVLEDIFVKSSFKGVASSEVFFLILIAGFGIQLFCITLVYSLYKDMDLDILIQHRLHSLNTNCDRDQELSLEEENLRINESLNGNLKSIRKLQDEVCNLPMKLKSDRMSRAKKKDFNKVK